MYPPPVVSLDTTRLYRQAVEVSLLDSNDLVIRDGLTKTRKALGVNRDSITFDNLQLSKKKKLHSNKSSGSTHMFRLRFDIAGQSFISSEFTVFSAASQLPPGTKRPKLAQKTITTAS